NSGVAGFINRFRSKSSSKSKETFVEPPSRNLDLIVFGDDEKKLDYTLANCCNPIPGDKVFGFVTVNRGIKVHKTSCPNAIELQANYAYRIQKAKWVDSSETTFRTDIIITGIDRMGLVKDITDALSNNLNIDMKSINFN